MNKLYHIYDLEVYRNYFLLRYKIYPTEEEGFFEISEYQNDYDKIRYFLSNKTFVGFNNKSYDDLVLEQLLLIVKDERDPLEITSKLKDFSDELIHFRERKPFPKLPYGVKTIDLMTLNRLDKIFKSLKQIGSEFFLNIEELPIDHRKVLTKEEQQVIFDYCGNDIEITYELFLKSQEELSLRYAAIDKYMLNNYVLSLDRPALAMAILKTYTPLIKPEIVSLKTLQVKDVVFDLIKFEDPHNIKWFENLKNDYLHDKFSAYTTIGGCNFKMAKGGLHSTMSSYSHFADDEYDLLDIDFGSFYPKIMINREISPKHLNKEKFLNALLRITTERLTAKKNKNKSVAEILKIVINSIFGQMGSDKSALYDFEAMMKVTINGQLILLMLAEQLAKHSQIVYGNTDGLTIKVHKTKREEVLQLLDTFSKFVNIDIEYADYKKMFIRDTNAYCIVKSDNELKLKGDYASFREDITKGFTPEIINQAAVEYLVNGTSIAVTVADSSLKDFLEGQKVDRKFQVIGHYYDQTCNKLVQKKLQQVNRYFVTNKVHPKTCRVYKTTDEKEISIKDESLITCNTKEEVCRVDYRELVDEKYYIKEVEKLTSIFEKSNNQLSLF